jgi:hypothetical protein
MLMTRSAEKMFMLPVSKAKALNIVVDRPCWEYGGANMLSFQCLSMALRNKKRLGQDVYWISWERIF